MSQNIPVALKGLSQKTPPNLHMPGEMVRAENVQVLKGGPSGLQFVKRYGTRKYQGAAYSPLGRTAVNPRHMVTLGNALVMDNDQALFVRDVAQDAWLSYENNGFNWTSSTDVISESLYQKVCPAHAYDPRSGNEIIAWYDQADAVRFSVRSRSTGAYLEHERKCPATLAFQPQYKVQAFAHPTNGYFYLVAPRTAGTTMVIMRVSAFTPQEPIVSYTIALDGSSSPIGGPAFDAQMNPEGLIILCARVPATTNMQVMAFDPISAGPALIGATVVMASAFNNAMWLSQNPFASLATRKYYLAISDNTNGLRVLTFDANASSPTTAVVDAARLGGNFVGYFDGSNPIVYVDQIIVGIPYNNSIFKGTVQWQRSVTLSSRAFLSNGTWFCLVRYDSAFQPTLFLFDMAAARIVGKVGIAGGQWSSLNLTYGQPAWVAQIGNDALVPVQAAHTALGQSVNSPIGTQIQGVSLVKFSQFGTVSKPTSLGGSLHYPGSIPWIFDGAQAVEAGFNVFPEAVTVTDSGAGFSKVAGAALAYRATYVWRDISGHLQESAPSPVVRFTPANAHDLSVAIPTCRLTGRNDIGINLYRNDPAQANLYRLVNEIAAANVRTADSITIVDILTELSVSADWATRALLYNGDGGASGATVELEHLAPPSHTIVTTAQNRNFLAGIDQDASAVLFSNEFAPDDLFGQTGVTYFDGNRFRIRGTVTAVVGRDRNVVAFTADKIWVVTGEYPDATGGSFPIPTPFELPHELGAIDPSALVTTSLGVFFMSKKGLHILGWDWSVTYIGGNVEDILGAYTIVGGLEVPALHQVRLYTSHGDVLVWDTVFNCWSSFTGLPIAAAACNWQDQPAHVDATGAIWQERAGTFGDNGAWIQSLLQFAIHAPAAIRGQFNLRALQMIGQVKGSHVLNASLGYNSQAFATTQYNSPQSGSSVYGDVTYGVGIYGGSGDGVLKLEIRPKKRQAAAYQLTLWDSLLSSGVSEGFTLEGITAMVEIQPGLARTQASQRMTKL